MRDRPPIVRSVLTETSAVTFPARLQMFRQVLVEQEPMKVNRFAVHFPEAFGIKSYLVQRLTKPRYRHSDGKPEWDDITLEFIDIVGPQLREGLCNMVDFVQDDDWLRLLNPKGGAALFSMTVEGFDPVGITVERWVIEVGEIREIDFGTCDYGCDDIQRIRVVLRPLNCRLL